MQSHRHPSNKRFGTLFWQPRFKARRMGMLWKTLRCKLPAGLQTPYSLFSQLPFCLAVTPWHSNPAQTMFAVKG